MHVYTINISIAVYQYLFIKLRYQTPSSYSSSALFQGPESLFRHLHRLNMGLVSALKYAASMMTLHDISTAPCAYCVLSHSYLHGKLAPVGGILTMSTCITCKLCVLVVFSVETLFL